MNIFEEKIKFEELLLNQKVEPLTVAYHGSLFNGSGSGSDIDVVLIVQKITPELFNKLNLIVKEVGAHLGISLVSVREAGTIFGGLKYLDALCRYYGNEERHPIAYYKIAGLNEQFRKNAIEMNVKKCTNIATIITKTINNFLGTNLKISVETFDSLVSSLEKNLDSFYGHEKIKVGRYSEKVEISR
ncbi:MAG: hypothetical protein Q7S43_00830 [bacterium]|nr:hypothetical protein [bacterium]